MRIREMLKKPVLSLDTGERVGDVEDALIEPSRQRIAGLLVRDGLLSSQQVIPFTEVHTAGADAVIVRTGATPIDAGAWISEGGPTYRSRDLYGKEVVTADGTRLGYVHDALVDQHDGRVYAVEVAGEVRARQHAVVHTGDIRVTGDVVVVTQVRSTAPAAPAAAP